LVVIIKDKLKTFPKWKLQDSTFLGETIGKKTKLAIIDENAPGKEQMCIALANLFSSILQIIQSTVQNLLECKISLLTIKNDMNASQERNGIVVHKLSENKYNTPVFKIIQNGQKEYKNIAKEVKNLLKSLRSPSVLSNSSVSNFIKKINKLNIKLQQLPMKCKNTLNGYDNSIKIDSELANECKIHLPKDDKNCNRVRVETIKKNKENALKIQQGNLNLTKNIQLQNEFNNTGFKSFTGRNGITSNNQLNRRKSSLGDVSERLNKLRR